MVVLPISQRVLLQLRSRRHTTVSRGLYSLEYAPAARRKAPSLETLRVQRKENNANDSDKVYPSPAAILFVLKFFSSTTRLVALT
jgi:hypothetical protein